MEYEAIEDVRVNEPDRDRREVDTPIDTCEQRRVALARCVSNSRRTPVAERFFFRTRKWRE